METCREGENTEFKTEAAISPFAGKPAPEGIADYGNRPDVRDPDQMVIFGSSGHRGSPLHGTFTEAHILAITQAICWRHLWTHRSYV